MHVTTRAGASIHTVVAVLLQFLGVVELQHEDHLDADICAHGICFQVYWRVGGLAYIC